MTETRPAPVRRSLVAVWAPWAAMAVIVVVALVVGALSTTTEPTNADRLNTISRSIKCPECSGESVAESNASVSQEMRADIAKRIQAGQTDAQIRQAYADQYGDYILLNPPATGVTSLVWILPVVVLALALAGLVGVFRRWRSMGVVHATAADRALVGHALGDDDLGDGGLPGVDDGGGLPGVADDDPELGNGR